MNSEFSSLSVRDIGEQGLLAILQRFCPSEIVGDDAAVISAEAGQSFVVTTDVLVDSVHFSDITTSPEDVGWRAAAANLSDIAAMGASPLGITVGLGLPGYVAVEWVERLYQGMTQCLQQYNTPIVGGDIVRSPTTTISISAFGQVHPRRTIRRDNAKVGDAIVVTGVHGASAAGLELLLHPEVGENLSNSDRTTLIQAHQRPKPRLDVLPILWEILNPDIPNPISGMDSSDGLADAVVQICSKSGVGAILERSQIPLPTAFSNWVTTEKALEYALYGGEDFELVLCLPQEPAHTLIQKLGKDASIIGRITQEQAIIVRYQQKETPDQVLTLSRGFQHFS
ncbi:MAG: thiamine-phosphate kinase [Scytonema sp. PMC 1069.18]|nr:thiamine-phosphate kinase [Scytonema sp. PMC 1069.18]MEC4884014.1 thiamine-phosphate kinase [Scytonema sp. PMC 1070.18]